MAGKKFSLIEVILSVICVVFTIEAAAPASAMGNVQFFWWIFLIITFLLPYGLVVAELGTAFDSEGGLYDWVRLGLGDRWGARCSWCYWVNFPLWAASIACMFPSVINAVWGIEFSLGIRIAIEIAFVWGVTVMAMQPVAEADWVMDGGAVIKVLITAVVGIVGIWFACNNGFANDMSFKTFIPDLGDTNSLTYLSIILFNFMGFEVVATFASTMKNPSRDIPKAVIAGGVAIAAIYIICGIGIGSHRAAFTRFGHCGRSRRYGGAHPPADDGRGRGLFGDAVRQYDLLELWRQQRSELCRAPWQHAASLCVGVQKDRHAQRLGAH
mgnify:CR=1 FL=1